jgi:putative sugar O-methyltransferase
MSVDFLLSVEDAYAILDAWTAIGKTTAPQVIIELGAGYGRLAYVVRKMLPNSTYIILDLPEALACSSSWLSAALPGEVVPYEETRSRTRFGRAELQSRRIWTLGTHQIEHIEDDAADVFANIRSFAEMPKAVIENYFAQLNRIDSGVFYTVQRKTEDNKADGQVVRESTYPIPPHWRQLYYRDVTSIERSFFQAAYATRSNH